jgi:hypothetical protein
LLYQAGEFEGALLSAFHHTAMAIQLPKDCYGHQTRTISAAIKAIDTAERLLTVISNTNASSSSPFLLPPNNFRSAMLDEILISPASAKAERLRERFRQENFDRKQKRYVAKRSALYFSPAKAQERHGVPDLKERPDIALSRLYRLGCYYEGNFHYDVGLTIDNHMDGKVLISCRERGQIYPKAKYVNLLVDDCLRE